MPQLRDTSFADTEFLTPGSRLVLWEPQMYLEGRLHRIRGQRQPAQAVLAPSQPLPLPLGLH